MIYGSWKVKVVDRKIAMVRGLDTPWMRLYILAQRPPDLYRAKRHIARSEYVTIPPHPLSVQAQDTRSEKKPL